MFFAQLANTFPRARHIENIFDMKPFLVVSIVKSLQVEVAASATLARRQTTFGLMLASLGVLFTVWFGLVDSLYFLKEQPVRRGYHRHYQNAHHQFQTHCRIDFLEFFRRFFEEINAQLFLRLLFINRAEWGGGRGSVGSNYAKDLFASNGFEVRYS